MNKKNNHLVTIILNWNRYDDTMECVESVIKADCPYNHKIIVVDNGSTDGSGKKLLENKNKFDVILVPENLGYAGGNNIGIKRGIEIESDYILILNNDVIVDENCIVGLLNDFSEIHDAGIVGPVVYSYPPPGKINFSGSRIDWFNGDHIDSTKKLKFSRKSEIVHGCAMMVRIEVFKEVGLFDEKYFLFLEDFDFCVKAERKGFGVYMSDKSKVWHKGSVSTYGSRENTNKYYFYYITRNKLLFLRNNFPYGKNLYFISACFTIFYSFILIIKIILGKIIFKRKNVLVLAFGILKGMNDFITRRYGRAGV